MLPTSNLRANLIPTNFSMCHALNSAKRILLIDTPTVLPLFSDREFDQQSIILTRRQLLTTQMLTNVRPDAIVGPLIAPGWDIVDLGLHLEQLGYSGNLFALTKPLPRAELVIREVSAVCRKLKVRLLEVDD